MSTNSSISTFCQRNHGSHSPVLPKWGCMPGRNWKKPELSRTESRGRYLREEETVPNAKESQDLGN